MEYVGVQTQIWRNNFRSVLLLIAFPLEMLLILWLFSLYMGYSEATGIDMGVASEFFLGAAPFVVIGVGIWLLVAWTSHSSMIRKATGSKPLERKENTKVYNLVENLCISRGLRVPKIYIIEDDSLNAFASGISEKTYAISLSRGIIEKLDDHELEGVIAHELTHIMNRDVRLLIVSIVFVGIFAFLGEVAARSLIYGGRGRGSKDNKGNAAMIILLLLLILGYFVALLTRFAISRKREYMADAGAVELTRNAPALANALRKIKGDPIIEAVKRDDVAQMFIEHPKKKSKAAAFLTGIFATHPPIDKRIALLEQF